MDSESWKSDDGARKWPVVYRLIRTLWLPIGLPLVLYNTYRAWAYHNGKNQLRNKVGLTIGSWTWESVIAVCSSVYYVMSLNDFVFSWQVVLLTGASSGIGEALAHELYQRGCKLILCARREHELKRVREDLMRTHTVSRVVSQGRQLDWKKQENYELESFLSCRKIVLPLARRKNILLFRKLRTWWVILHILLIESGKKCSFEKYLLPDVMIQILAKKNLRSHW